MNGSFQFTAQIAQAIGSRSEQEDAAVFKSDERRGFLGVLCDGMGGMADGARFSAIGTTTMMRRFETGPQLENPCDELLACFEEAQAEALRAQGGPNEPRGGSTVTAVLIRDGRCAFLSSGDSRIYLMRRGALIQLNREQTLGAMLDVRAALGFIPEEEARSSIRRAALIGHLGMEKGEPCDRNLSPFALISGDRLALMSDGVFGTLDERTLTRLLALPVRQAARAVIDETIARNRPKQDNCSVLLIGCKAGSQPPAKYRR